jgi:hypothetical protein
MTTIGISGNKVISRLDSPGFHIPMVMIKGESARGIVISEAHSLLAHLGTRKTFTYLRDHVWWKTMAADTLSFCESCATCKRSKPSNQKPYGLLNPLPVPGTPWEAIGIDFVGPLPESRNRDGVFDSITVVICLLTAMVHLVPSRITYNARQVAELVFEHIYKLHGLPKHIISDRDVLFTSTFWARLNQLIGTKLKMSSAYHPEMDGSTERANRTITQMLRQCVNSKQTDWVAKLPAIEFALNSARSESTGYAPFFLNTGRMPRSMIWDSSRKDEYLSVRNFAQQRKFAIIAAHDSILAARVKQTRHANQWRRLAPFQENDLVYISTKNISFPKGLARKLIPKFIGPYKVLNDFKNQSFRIELPPHLKQRGVHDVFHASLLRIHVPNDDRLFPGRLFTQLNPGSETESEWAVDRIISHSGSRRDAVFEVLWKAGDVTWLPYSQIEHLNALKEYIDLQGADNIDLLPTGKGKPPQQDPQVYLGSISPCTTSQNYKYGMEFSWDSLLELPNYFLLPTALLTYLSLFFVMTLTSPTTETASPSIVEDQLAPLVDLDVTLPLVGPSGQVIKDSNLAPSSDVVAISGDISSHFMVPSIGENLIDLHSDPKDFPFLSGPAVAPFSSIDAQSIIAAALQGLSPSQVKGLLGNTIQSVFCDALASLKPSILKAVTPTISNTNDKQSYAVSVIPKSAIASKIPASAAPSAPAAPATPSSANAPTPMIIDEDGFQVVTCRPFPNTYPTIDHPNLRRTSYTIFRLSDPINRTTQLFHAGQLVLFCTASNRIIAEDYHSTVLPAGYIAFETAFNEGAHITPKCFATFSIHTGSPIIPSDPISIADFRIDRDYVRALERSSPRITSAITSDSTSGKKPIASKSPDELKFRKHADTPYSQSSTRRDKSKNKAKASGSSNMID